MLTCVLPVVGQTPAAPVPVDPMIHWRNATVALGQEVTIGTETKFIVTGSAVIATLDGKRACLLTARHMVVDPANGQLTRALWMRVASVGGEHEVPKSLPLFDGKGKNLWVVANDGSDLAVIPLPPHPSYLTPNYDAVFASDFAETDDDIFQGAPVLVLGYPQVLRESDNTNPFSTSPIARHGIIAWIDPSGPLSKPFLVDANLYEGNSGGPVFRVKTGFDRFGNFNVGGQQLKFIGIVSKGNVQASSVVTNDGKVTKSSIDGGIPQDEFAVVRAIGGIGVIEPVSRVKTLLDTYFAKH